MGASLCRLPSHHDVAMLTYDFSIAYRTGACIIAELPTPYNDDTPTTNSVFSVSELSSVIMIPRLPRPP